MTLKTQQTGSPHTKPPLCVDLDGTLLATDTLWEALFTLIKSKPFHALAMPLWLLGGRAAFKGKLFALAPLNPESLPYREDVLTFLQKQKQDGQTLLLATGTDVLAAQGIADHLGLFDRVIASDGQTNCTGLAKLDAIRQNIGNASFDYIGNSRADLPLWQASRNAYLVTPSPRVQHRANAICSPVKVFGPPSNRFQDLLEAMRPKQWAKNLLLIVPLAAGHELGDLARWLEFLLGFVAFSLCASAIYMLNDLFDLDADRHHEIKRGRPFAAARLTPDIGLLAAASLLPAAFILSLFTLPKAFTGMLLIYVLLTVAYSVSFKRKLILDVIFLAALYTLRIVAGGMLPDPEVKVFPTPWLLAFSMFLFLSLAFLKRYAELLRLHDRGGKQHAPGRGYVVDDLDLIRAAGTNSGYLAVLVFAFYINNSDAVHDLYPGRDLLWFVCPVLLYWITRLWILTGRGIVCEDPVLFALTDRVSYGAGAVLLCIVIAASKIALGG